MRRQVEDPAAKRWHDRFLDEVLTGSGYLILAGDNLFHSDKLMNKWPLGESVIHRPQSTSGSENHHAAVTGGDSAGRVRFLGPGQWWYGQDYCWLSASRVSLFECLPGKQPPASAAICVPGSSPPDSHDPCWVTDKGCCECVCPVTTSSRASTRRSSARWAGDRARCGRPPPPPPW